MTKTKSVINGKLFEVGFARDFQNSARESNLIEFANSDLELKLYKAKPDQILAVQSTINSPKKIISVEIQNKEFIRKAIC